MKTAKRPGIVDFIREYLGYKVAQFHREWLQLHVNGTRTLLLAPRGHGKTTIASIAYSLYLIACDPDVRILVISATQAQAAAFVREMRYHLASNEKLKEAFAAGGEFLNRKDKNSETELIVHRAAKSKEATVSASSVGSSFPIGKHFDVIIADDIIDNKNTAKKAQREKLGAWFATVLSPTLEPGGSLHVIGTRWNYADLYSELLSEDSGYISRVYRALSESGEALWPELFDAPKLESIRKQIGSHAFSSQYLNEPLPDEDALFKPEWLRYYREPPEKLADKFRPRVYMAVDPAMSQAETADYTAVVTLAEDPETEDIYVLDARRMRATFNGVIAAIEALYRKWRPALLGIEEVAFSGAFREVLLKKGRYPIARLKPDGDKVRRALTASSFMENGKIYFRKEMEELVYELLTFPRGSNDDLVDAFVYALKLAGRSEPWGTGGF